MSWKQLLAQRKVQLHTTSKQELDSLRALIERDLTDARWPEDDQQQHLEDVAAALLVVPAEPEEGRELGEVREVGDDRREAAGHRGHEDVAVGDVAQLVAEHPAEPPKERKRTWKRKMA